MHFKAQTFDTSTVFCANIDLNAHTSCSLHDTLCKLRKKICLWKTFVEWILRAKTLEVENLWFLKSDSTSRAIRCLIETKLR